MSSWSTRGRSPAPFNHSPAMHSASHGAAASAKPTNGQRLRPRSKSSSSATARSQAAAPTSARRFVARPGPLATSLAVGVVALVVYSRTLAPSVPTGDSGELITVAWVLGIAHPPGYPLFSMVGHLFTLLPFGSPAFRVNLMSALFAAAGGGLTVAPLFPLGGPPGGATVVGGLSASVSTPLS